MFLIHVSNQCRTKCSITALSPESESTFLWANVLCVFVCPWQASFPDPPYGQSGNLTSPWLALGDRFWLFIQTLNNDKKLFNSIFNSKTNLIIHSKNLFIQKLNQIIHSKNLFIQKLNQIIHSKNYSLKMDKTTQLEKTVKNRQKKPVLTSKGAFY